jgi:hypothetical protein
MVRRTIRGGDEKPAALSSIIGWNMTEGIQQLAKVREAASALIGRLADRAAYATEEEYKELRSLMTALRGLTEATG